MARPASQLSPSLFPGRSRHWWKCGLALVAGIAVVAGCDGDGNGTGVEADYSLSLTPAAVTIVQGGTGTVTVTLTRTPSPARWTWAWAISPRASPARSTRPLPPATAPSSR